MSDEADQAEAVVDESIPDDDASADAGEQLADELDVGPESAEMEISEDTVVALVAERDEYLDALQRLKADFANARRRSDEQAASRRLQAEADLVEKLLPVLDSCDAALGHGVEEIKPISDALFDVLAARGLRRVDPVGEPFDPEQHEAVLHEEGEGIQIVTETLRTGYAFNDRVLRPAMVKVQG